MVRPVLVQGTPGGLERLLAVAWGHHAAWVRDSLAEFGREGQPRGTARDNAADMVRKGRARHKAFPGETHHGHILSERQVLEIRQRRGESARALAAEYGVQRWTVYDILSRRSWRHV